MEERPKTKGKGVSSVTINDVLYYDINETAKRLSMSTNTLRREVGRRNIRHLRMFSKIYFRPEWCDEWLERHIVQPRKTR